jgi:hypothetical protein
MSTGCVENHGCKTGGRALEESYEDDQPPAQRER